MDRSQMIDPENFEFDPEPCWGEFETSLEERETDFGEFKTFHVKTPTALQLEDETPVEVSWVQDSLNRILGLRLSVDGIAGPEPRSAIRAFQQKRGLTDGIVGPETQATMTAAGAFRSGSAPSHAVAPIAAEPIFAVRGATITQLLGKP